MSKAEMTAPAEGVHSQTERLTGLLDAGPETLVRGGEPLITAPDFISQKDSERLRRFRESYLQGRTSVSHVTARDVVETALTQVKHSKDYYGCWGASIPHDFYRGVVGEMTGKENSTPTYFWESPNAAEMFFRKIRPMEREVFKSFDWGTLVEFGVLAVGRSGDSALASVSVPYELPKGLQMEKPWWMKLSPDESAGFVGREAELAIFDEILQGVKKEKKDDLTVNASANIDLFGRPINTSKIARIYDQDDAKIWWGMATNLNNIISLYAPNAHDRLDAPSTGERIYADIVRQGFSDSLQKSVVSPEFLTGYYIELVRSKDLSFKQVLHVDTDNWVSSKHYKSRGKRSSAYCGKN